MGCLKLTYYEQRVLGKNHFFSVGALEKNALEEKNRVSSLRYGFIGQENDNEVKNITGGSQYHSFRSYDPRLGRGGAPKQDLELIKSESFESGLVQVRDKRVIK